MDPSWSFRFHLSPQDYEAICHYREYGPYAYRPDSSTSYSESGDMVWLQSPEDLGSSRASSIYYLGYDVGKSLCVLTSVNF
ncbi:hypothetical protein [Haloferula sp. BvORR071]|uniref:hypothetical protein n=1 Tax=Haloferula sp. BvORR071 TaxID=1396141 RepID=UPI00224103CF|nr:hypothetical protein [Haloferula sp. BvORR071]